MIALVLLASAIFAAGGCAVAIYVSGVRVTSAAEEKRRLPST
jgi:hypothetical protein